MKYTFENAKEKEIIKGHIKLGTNVNPAGDVLDVNSLYFTRNGKPFIAVMGEYHYERDNKENWRTELLKMKAGGVSIVATYLFWIYHEEEEGKWNFEGDLDTEAFLKVCAEVGLDVVLRVGPWAHGEARNGGFPDWLVNKPFKLRDNNSEYLAYVRKWLLEIYSRAKGFFYKDGGPVIAVQLENELVDNSEHILELKNMAVEIGYDVPFYTATGWNSKFGAKLPIDEVIPVFGAYADAPWSDKVAELPLSAHYSFHTERNDTGIGVDLLKEKSADGWSLPYDRYPFATCEIGPGMESTHHRRVIMQGRDAYAMSLVKLGVGNNLIGYYMYHGGVNKIGKLSAFNEDKKTGYPNDVAIISYDFGTCISQYGQIREQYRLLNLLHLFVNDFGDVLAPMQTVGAEKFVDEFDDKNLRYCMRTHMGSGFVFANNYQRHAELSDHTDVEFDTGSVVFPKMNVNKGDSFILPFNIALDKEQLVYATAQLLCREGNTFYFMEIAGNSPKFKFADGSEYTGSFSKGNISVRVVSRDEARYLRKIEGKVYITPNKDIYVDNGSTVEIKSLDTETVLLPSEPFAVDDIMKYELTIGGERELTYKKVEVKSADGFAVIDEPDYDVAILYADGKPIADNYNEFIKWRVPAKLLYGKDCRLVMSELKDDYYVNRDDVLAVRSER